MLIQKGMKQAQIQEIDVKTVTVTELTEEASLKDSDFVRLFDFLS